MYFDKKEGRERTLYSRRLSIIGIPERHTAVCIRHSPGLLIRSVRILSSPRGWTGLLPSPPPKYPLLERGGCTTMEKLRRGGTKEDGSGEERAIRRDNDRGCAPFNFIREEQAERRRSSRSMLGEAPHRSSHRETRAHTHIHTHHRTRHKSRVHNLNQAPPSKISLLLHEKHLHDHGVRNTHISI